MLDHRPGQFQGLDLLPGVAGLAENLVGLRSQQGGGPADPHGGLGEFGHAAQVIGLAKSWMVPGNPDGDRGRAQITTFAPSRANSLAMARPRPRLAPVTMATNPLILPIGYLPG